MTNYRSELQKLIASFDEHLGVHNDSLLRAVEEARASLEEPVAAPAGPTDDELLALVPQGSESDFYLPKGLPSNWDHGDFIAPPEAVVAFARAVLARYGHQSAPPVEGEGLPSDQEIADVFSQGCRDLSCSHEPPFLGGKNRFKTPEELAQ